MDISYSWDENGIGVAGLLPGIMGFAYLESPGIAYDGVDNDDDGIIDEKEIIQATAIVGPTEGIADLAKFLDFYKLTAADLKIIGMPMKIRIGRMVMIRMEMVSIKQTKMQGMMLV